MNNKSVYWGIGITVLWFVVIFLFWFFGDLDSPDSLNELGDFLAGIFAPVAFLWLVLGYIQQGRQLEQNTKALEQQERALQLQVEEMKEVTTQQKLMTEIQAKELKTKFSSVEPYMQLLELTANLVDKKIADGYLMNFNMSGKLTNLGKGDAIGLTVFSTLNRPLGSWQKIAKDSNLVVSLVLNDDEFQRFESYVHSMLIIKYLDIFGEETIQSLKLTSLIVEDAFGNEVWEVNCINN